MKGSLQSGKWTYEEYLLLPDDGKRHEIIHGEMFVSAAPTPRHQKVLLKLLVALSKFLEKRDIGEVLLSPIDVLLENDSVVQPDLLFIRKERLSIIGERAIIAAPDLVIEVRSPTTQKLDSVDKRALYAEQGVREYWIVDPDSERIEIFLLEGKILEKKAAATEGRAKSLSVLPGFSASLSEIFAG